MCTFKQRIPKVSQCVPAQETGVALELSGYNLSFRWTLLCSCIDQHSTLNLPLYYPSALLTPPPAWDSLLSPFHCHNPRQDTHTPACVCVCVARSREQPSHDWQPHSHIASYTFGSFSLPVGSVHLLSLLCFCLLGKATQVRREHFGWTPPQMDRSCVLKLQLGLFCISMAGSTAWRGPVRIRLHGTLSLAFALLLWGLVCSICWFLLRGFDWNKEVKVEVKLLMLKS